MYKTLNGACKEKDPGSSVCAKQQDQRQWAQTETQEVSTSRDTVAVRVTEHWHREPRELPESPSLEIFKSHPHMALDNWFWEVQLEREIRADDY